METTKTLERVKCSIGNLCWFERDANRVEGRLVSCPAHSFGEIEAEDYAKVGIDPVTGQKQN